MFLVQKLLVVGAKGTPSIASLSSNLTKEATSSVFGLSEDVLCHIRSAKAAPLLHTLVNKLCSLVSSDQRHNSPPITEQPGNE